MFAIAPLKSLQERLSETGFAVLLTSVFAVLCLLGLLHHEMWRDELQTWMVARDSSSIPNLLQNLKYETGHSFLWHLCLFGISRLTRSPLAMQLFHGAIAIAVVALIARFAPCSRLHKTLLACGYFPFYEYAIISRNYALSLLCVVAFCILFPQRHKSYLPLAGLLFLLENTNSYSLVLAFALGVTLVVDYLSARMTAGVDDSVSKPDIALSLIIWLGGIILGLKLMLPPVDGGVVVDTPVGFDPGRLVATLAIFWKSYVPIPGLTLRFWNTNILDDGYAAVLSLLLLPFAIALFTRKSLVFFFYCLGSAAIFWLSYTRFLGVMRHWGYLFLVWFACLWLSHYCPDRTGQWHHWFTASKVGQWLNRYRGRFIMAILVVQAIAAWLAFSIDLAHPFSAAKQVAQFIQSQPFQQFIMVGDDPFATLSVSGYLDRPLYYPARGQLGTYAIFDNRNRSLTQPELLAQVQELSSIQQRPLLLVLNYPLVIPPIRDLQVFEVKRFIGAIVKDENFYLYQVRLDQS